MELVGSHERADQLVNLYLHDPHSPHADEVRRLADEVATRIEELERERQQLEDYRDRYIDLYDFAPLGYVSLDEEGFIQEINLAGAQLLGMDRHALTGYPLVDYVDAQDIQAFQGHVRNCIEHRAETTSEVRLVIPGGGAKTVQLRSIPVEDRKHDIILCKTAIADISERKQFEEALRESQERLQLAVLATGLGTWDYDLVGGGITWSREAKRMFGIGPETEIDYREFLALVHADDRQRVDIAVHEAMTANGTGEYHEQYRVQWPDGSVHWLDSNGQAHFREVEGVRRAVRFVGTVLDVTERKLPEEALRNSEARHRAILESSVDAIITINDRGIIDSVNPATQRLFGYAPDELIGQNVNILMPSPDREQHDSYIANYLRTGQPKIIGIGREVVARRKDGTTFPMDLSVSDMNVGGRRMFTGLIHDVTDRKRAEEELRQARDELEISVQERTAELTAANQRLKYDRYLFDMLMDHLPNSIYFKDAEGRFIRISKSMAAACQLADSNEAVGKTDFDFFTAEDAGESALDEEQIRRTGQPLIDKEDHERWRDGRTRWVSTTKMPLYDETGRIVGTFGIRATSPSASGPPKPCAPQKKLPKPPAGRRAPSSPT